MNRILILGLAATSLALSACGSSDVTENASTAVVEANTQQTAAAAVKPKTEAQRKAELKQFQDSIEAAMADIPPQHREQFQKLFSCEIKKNQQRTPPKDIDAQTIRALTAQLQQDPHAGDTCA